MKKLFILLLIVIAFVACNNEAVDDIDYSTWTVEELLTTGGGIDYLVSQSKEINYDELNNRLKTEVLGYNDHIKYIKRDGVWSGEKINGNICPFFVLMENNTFRMCYEPSHDWSRGKGYKTYDAHDNAVAEMVGKMEARAKIKAYAGNAIVIEFYSGYGYPCRAIATFRNLREQMLNEYVRDFDNPQSWMGK